MRFKLIFLSIITVLVCKMSDSFAQNSPKIRFTLSFSQPQTHYINVEMHIDGISKENLDVFMPVWAPGSYLVREFSKNVEGVVAKGTQGDELAVNKIRKNGWRIETKGSKSVTLNYQVYAFEISVRTSFVDENHAFISPTGVFMYVKESFNNPVTVKVIPHHTWSKISTGLTPVNGKVSEFVAKDFDWLFDSPIEVGNQDVFEFTAAGVKHEVAMVGGGNYDKVRLAKDMTKIVEEATAIFKENPNDRYVFIVHNYKNGGGGLEHLNSTVLGAKRMEYDKEETYAAFLGLVAHEYFHVWNVKRLRPVALGPFDYDNENYTTDLWIAEGFTAYYDNLVTKRAKCISENQYLQLLADDIETQINLPGDKIQSVAESSFDAWIKYYRQNENSSNSMVSYYTKGSLLGLILDLKILDKSKGKHSLDDVMLKAYNQFYKTEQRGFTSDEFKETLESVLGSKLDDFYTDYVYGTKSIDYATLLDKAGLELMINPGNDKPALGVSVNKSNIITKVVRDGSAWLGGLNVNDELIAINGIRVDELSKLVQGYKVGDSLDVLVNRDGVIKTFNMKLLADNSKKVLLVKKGTMSKQEQAIYNKWLRM